MNAQIRPPARRPGPLKRLIRPLIKPDVFDFWASRLHRTWTWERPLARLVAREAASADAVTLLGRIVESVQVATTRPIRLVTEGEPPHVLADPDRFAQVFTNLVDNAIRHGAGTVTVDVAPMPADDVWPGGVRISVCDEGEGIAPEMRRRVFTKFWTSRQSGGSGLGLYLVQGLVRAHGGEVRIEDVQGEGGEPHGARITVDWPSPTD